jgi:hypothetical protein
MIKLENTKVMGWEPAIRGMRNPKNSWDKSDSYWTHIIDAETSDICDFEYFVGDNDHELMMRLAKGGPVHAKYRRMIMVYVDITAPLYWWKEFDTYKIGTVANSCSTMHKIHAKEFTLDDFSCERMHDAGRKALRNTIDVLNFDREMFNKTKDKSYWDDMIQLLPTSYNQKRTVMLNYEVLAGIYPMRGNHKLLEWVEFCEWIKNDLPYSELVTCNVEKTF